MELKFCKNIEENTYEMLLHGEVGVEINGREVASEILYLNSIGAKVIKERINTIGGGVIDAYSIVAANLSSECEIHTINEGVADSAGSFILASGSKRSAFDFATMLVHNVSYDGIMLEDMEDGPLKKDLTIMRDSIVTILSNNSGKTREEITAMMNESKRMTAKEAKEFGFIDEIIKSKNTPKILENMSMAEIMNVCREFHKPKKQVLNNNNNMKTVLNFLNLSEDANEASALSAVQAIENKATEAEGKVKNLETEVSGLKNQVSEKDSEIVELKATVKGFEDKAKDAAVENAVKSGKFSEDQKEDLRAKVDAMGVDNFNEMVDMVKLPKADAAGQVQNSDGSKTTKNEKLANEYQDLATNDPQELERIKNEEKPRFEAMLNAWNEAK